MAGWLLAAMVAVGPVIVDPFGWDNFGPIRLLVVAGLGFWAVTRSIGGASFFDQAPLPRLWVALLVWGALCSVLAADRLYAWIGTPDRRFGWLTWLLCAGVFLTARQLGLSSRRRIIRGFAIGATGLGCYTFLEWFGSRIGSGPLWPTIEVSFSGGRAGGPFGQPAFLGAAAVLIGPVAAGLAGDRTERREWRIVGGVGAATCLLAILASQSRAAWIGVLVAGAVYFLVHSMAFLTVRRPVLLRPGRHRVVAAGVLGSFVIPVLLISGLRQRVTGAFGSDGVVAGRTDEWMVGLRALADSPIFGYGSEGYRTVFGAHVDDRYVQRWGWEVITDRSHNGLLDVALAFGVPGALLFGAMLVLAVRAAIAAIRSQDSVSVLLGVGVIASVVQQQFLFPLSEVDPLLWVAIGLLPALKTDRTQTWSRFRSPVLQPVAAGLSVGLAVIVTIAAALDVLANVRIGLAVSENVESPVISAELGDAAQAAAQLRPDSIRYLFIGARAARLAGDLSLALERIEAGLERSPSDPALLGEQGRLLLEIARAEPPGPDRQAAISNARLVLESLVAGAPHQPEHLQRLGIARALDGDVEAGIAAMEEAVRLAPDRPEPQQNLVELRRLAEEQ